MGYFSLDSKKLDQRGLLIALKNGFEVTKPTIQAWLRTKYKTAIYPQPFGGRYIGTLIINGKTYELGNEKKPYFKYQTEDECFAALLERAFEILNQTT